jgi:hypothetical protein
MRAERFLVMISESYEKKKAGQKGNDDNPDRSSGKEFEMKMLRAKKPRGTSAKDPSTDLRCYGRVDLGHYKFHKSK